MLSQQQGVASQQEQSCSVNSQDRLKLVVGPHPPVELQSLAQEPPPLSPISETPPPTGIRSRASSSGTNTRSVSAAVSDESVAGDSGVFEACNRKRLSGPISDVDPLASGEMSLETAQVQIKLSLIAATATAVCRFIAEVDLFNGTRWRDVLCDGVDRPPPSVTKPRRSRPICHRQRGRRWISN
ncbi:uncharacterized protein [Temnothorax nylanderi]|uniref:uncharacterized protein isoform X2 n=1 Tax=Temnothorax nylanderi TaxID=102681 RepID=UPI003A85027C